MNYRVAFASTGELVDQHFGSARCFQIYDITGGQYEYVETRQSEAKCRGGCEGGFGHLLEVLKDCDAVFVGRIGMGAAAFMSGHGKRVFEASGAVKDILVRLTEGKLLRARVFEFLRKERCTKPADVGKALIAGSYEKSFT